MDAERGLHIVVSTQLERLLDDLAHRLHAYREAGAIDAFTAERIVVPSQGLRRWLTLALADRFGVAGGFEMPFLLPFLEQLQDAVLGQLPETRRRALRPEVLNWHAFDALERAASAPAGSGVVSDYLSGDADRQVRREQLADRVTDRLQVYRAFRPEILASWERGEPVEPRYHTTSWPTDHEAWQRELWRKLAGKNGPGSRHLALLEALRGALQEAPHSATDSAPRELGGPVHVFGFGTIPPPMLEVLDALARHVPVYVQLIAPSSEYWSDVRRARGNADAVGNALLASLGTPARETFDALLELEESALQRGTAFSIDCAEDSALQDDATLQQGSVLELLQHDVRAVLDRGPHPGADAEPLPATAFEDDDSLEIFCAHGPLREMEVVRDRLLEAFAEDSTLRPDDVVVLVPDVERFAPFAEAAFGAVRRAADADDPEDANSPLLPYRIADRAPGGTDPCAAAMAALLQLVEARRDAIQVLDLLEWEPIRDRIGLRESDLPTLRGLVAAGGIAWGADAEARSTWVEDNTVSTATWEEGMDRLLLGHAVGPLPLPELVELPGGALLPAADATASGRAELLGALGQFREALFEGLDRLRNRQSLTEHTAAVRRLLDRLFDDRGPHRRGIERLREQLDELDSVGISASVAFPAFQADLLRRLQRSASARAIDFPSGRVTICALRPLRTVPFRIVCVAGLASGAFPRGDLELPFDLVRAERRPGDRSTRADDQLLFLETLLAARERLILTYAGRSPRDDAELGPCSSLAELLDVLDRSLDAGGRPARKLFTTAVPLQAFDERHFNGEEPRLRSYAAESFAAARALRTPAALPPLAPWPKSPDRPVEGSPGNPNPADSIDLQTLIRFWQNPARAFVTEVLQAELEPGRRAAELARTECLELDGLREWQAKSQLNQLLAGTESEALGNDRQQLLEILAQASLLPAGHLAEPWFEPLWTEVRRLCDALPTERPVDAAVDLTLPAIPGRHPKVRLLGVVTGLSPHGVVLSRIGKARARDHVTTWITHLAWCLQREAAGLEPQPSWFVTEAATERFEPVATETARGLIAPLVVGYLHGQHGPLPFLPDLAAEFDKRRAAVDGDVAPLVESFARQWNAPAATQHAPSWLDDSAARAVFRNTVPLAAPAGAGLRWIDEITREISEHQRQDTAPPWLHAENAAEAPA